MSGNFNFYRDIRKTVFEEQLREVLSLLILLLYIGVRSVRARATVNLMVF